MNAGCELYWLHLARDLRDSLGGGLDSDRVWFVMIDGSVPHAYPSLHRI